MPTTKHEGIDEVRKMENMFGTRYDGKPLTAEEQCGALSPEFLADWLIKYHGAKEDSRNAIVLNLKTQAHAERAIGFIEGRAKAELHMHLSLFGKASK